MKVLVLSAWFLLNAYHPAEFGAPQALGPVGPYETEADCQRVIADTVAAFSVSRGNPEQDESNRRFLAYSRFVCFQITQDQEEEQ
jgi:hypothetical protein